MPRNETQHKIAKVLPPGKKLIQITNDSHSHL